MVEKILKELGKLEDNFYGKEEDDFEGGVFEEDYECAEWARSNMDTIFSMVRTLAKEVNAKSKRLAEAEDLLTEAHDLLDDVHCYESQVYRDISKYFNGDEE